ncbi:GAF domain-containing protein [Mangrovimicrobium sediminis]|nr:GAF domain-containing protein [Haliea sp. SAOS-164]
MQKPAYPDDEAARQASLDALQILDTLPEERFDRLARLASVILDTPVAVMSLVDRERQWFKAMVGLTAREYPRDSSFCGHTILQETTMVVPDALEDERFRNNPLVVTDPNIRFYAGQPIKSPDGRTIGTLSVIDQVPRNYPAERQLAALRDLASILEEELCRSADATRAEDATGAPWPADIEAMIRAGGSARLLLDQDLVLRRFTPCARDYFAVQREDMDKPLSAVECYLDYPSMMQDLANVAAYGDTSQRLVDSVSGRKIAVELSPFREAGHARYSVIVSLLDVTTREQACDLEHVLDGLPERVAAIDRSGKIFLTNRAWDTFSKQIGDPLLLKTSIGTDFIEMCRKNGRKDAAATARALRDILDGKRLSFTNLYDYELDGEERSYIMTITATGYRNQGIIAIVSNIEVTDWRRRGDLYSAVGAD